MALAGIIDLTAGNGTGPFNLYSDVDSYTTPFETNIPKSAMTNNFLSINIPVGTNTIKVDSVGECINQVYLPFECNVVEWISDSRFVNPTMCRLTDGSIWGWGQNSVYGELGVGTSFNYSYPQPVFAQQDFVKISIGQGHGLGLTSSGTLWAWGRNESGQLGDGTTTSKRTPVAVCTSLSFIDIAAGQQSSLALTHDGNAYGWGLNNGGQVGDNTITNRCTPVAVCGGITFSTITMGNSHSAGLTSSGIAYMWGTNQFGELGDNSTVSKLTPVAVCGGLTFSQISAGANHSMGVTTTGVGYGWGSGNSGRLGRNSTSNTSTPVAVCGGLTWSMIKASSGQCSGGLTSTGLAYMWGRNNNGVLGADISTSGFPGTAVCRLTPIAVCQNRQYTDLNLSNGYAMALGGDKLVYGWGATNYGALGNGNAGFSNVSTPIIVQFYNLCPQIYPTPTPSMTPTLTPSPTLTPTNTPTLTSTPTPTPTIPVI